MASAADSMYKLPAVSIPTGRSGASVKRVRTTGASSDMRAGVDESPACTMAPGGPDADAAVCMVRWRQIVTCRWVAICRLSACMVCTERAYTRDMAAGGDARALEMRPQCTMQSSRVEKWRFDRYHRWPTRHHRNDSQREQHQHSTGRAAGTAHERERRQNDSRVSRGELF